VTLNELTPIVFRHVGSVSIMPVNLVESLSPAEFTDLISFLVSIKQPQNPLLPRDPQKSP
jgi:hypothetical protein